MRRKVWFSLAVTALACIQLALAQGFSGMFTSVEGGLSLSLQQGQDGTLSGVLNGPSGQFAVQGQSNGGAAFGVVESTQGPLGFQAALSGDGNALTIEFYQVGANGQPAPAGPPIAFQRSGAGVAPPLGQMPGMPGQVPGQVPGQLTGGFPGQAAGGFPNQTPGAFPGQAPGGLPNQTPGAFPGQTPGGVPAQVPGGIPGQLPAQAPGGMPAQTPGGFPPQPPGVPGAMGIDWNGTFVGNAGATVLYVQGSQGAYAGYIQDQGQQFQFQAHLDDLTLHGSFMAGGAEYEFWADRNGGSVMLYLGNTTYLLQQAASPGMP